MLKVFPNADVRYCFYHICRALFSHLHKGGLLPLYAVPDAKNLLRCFMMLPFAPVEEVVHAYSEICAALTNLIDDGTIEQRFRIPLNSKWLDHTSLSFGSL